MKKLYFLRHAEADNNQIDKLRELTKFGINQAINIGNYIIESNINIDLILSSSSIRTKSTVEYILNRTDSNIDLNYLDILYNSDWEMIYDQIKFTNDKYNSLMIVSHNPSIADIVYKLSNEEHIIKPATIISFESSSPNWRAIEDQSFSLKKIYYG